MPRAPRCPSSSQRGANAFVLAPRVEPKRPLGGFGLFRALPFLLFAVQVAWSQNLALELELVVGGLTRPVSIAHAGDGSGRLFIVQQTGEILIFNGTTLLLRPFLDLSALVSCCGEQGLLGLAFHPEYATNGFFYVHYTDVNGDTVVARYSVSTNANVADAGSNLTLLTWPQPFMNHNGGQLAFGPDGLLYVGLGDGGDGGDPGNRGQDLTTLLGKILRIDVDSTDPGLNYAVPPSNPFFDSAPSLPEIWAYGLRNPWRFSFDRATGDLLIGDVGQNDIEEIDFQPMASPGGENYGWRLMEGSACFNPQTGCNDGSLTLPILEYSHFLGCSVTGGYVYRGNAYPQLRGVYLYGDFCTGTIWGTVPRCDNAFQSQTLLQSSLSISTFGEDEGGELYAAHFSFTGGNSALFRVHVSPAAGGPTLTASPSSLDFGTVLLGNSPTLGLELENSNVGLEAVRFVDISTSDPSRFLLNLNAGVSPCGTQTACLDPGERCTLEITFDSPTQGIFNESLDLDVNAILGNVPLQGTAFVPCTFNATETVANQTVSDNRIVEACDRVTAGPRLVVDPSGDLTLRAGNRVVIENGVVIQGRLAVIVDPLLAIE